MRKSEHEYEYPEFGASHKCMLVLSQSTEMASEALALEECTEYGFDDVKFSGYGVLQIHVLNTDQYRGFSGFYEEALGQGCSLLNYPN